MINSLKNNRNLINLDYNRIDKNLLPKNYYNKNEALFNPQLIKILFS